MKISCSIIRDLLPLYAENLASEDTRTLVDEHLKDCEDCTNVLSGMQRSAPVLPEKGMESLNKVKKIIRRRRLISVLAAIMTVITVASAVFTYIFTPFQLTREQALDDFYIREDGAVVVDYSPCVTGRLMSGNGENWYLNQYSNRYDMWKGDHRKSIGELYGHDGIISEEERQRYEGIDIIYGTWKSAEGNVKSDAPIPWDKNAMQVSGGADWNWWYADPRGLGDDILLHDAGKPYPEYDEMFSPVYPAVFYGGMMLAVVLLILRKKICKPVVRELAVRLTILAGSAAISTFLVSSGRIFTSTVGIIDQYWGWMIPMNTVFLTLTALLYRQLYLIGKNDQTV